MAIFDFFRMYIAVVSSTSLGEFTSFYSSESENAIHVNKVNTVHAVKINMNCDVAMI